MPLLQQNKEYTIEDIYALPDGQRAELIDGQMYMMAPPTRRHQQILLSLSRKIADYIDNKGGSCIKAAPVKSISPHLPYFWMKMIKTMSSRI